MNKRKALISAKDKKLIVQFRRPFEPGSIDGLVMDIGPEFFLLASFDGGFQFDCFTFLRIKDVRRLESPAKRSSFYKAVRKIRGDKTPTKPKFDLTNIISILESASPSLLTIHCEKKEPDICRIGYALSSDDKTLEMIEIDPDAKWEAEPTYIKLRHITRIDLPGPYERALMLVGGMPAIFSK